MAIQQVDDNGDLWFISDKSSNKNRDVEDDARVQLLLIKDGKNAFLSVYGQAKIVNDKAKLKELWNPLLKTWFKGGIDDPSISLIRVTPEEGYYWDTKHGKMIQFAKMLASVATGKTMDDGIEGKLEMR